MGQNHIGKTNIVLIRVSANAVEMGLVVDTLQAMNTELDFLARPSIYAVEVTTKDGEIIYTDRHILTKIAESALITIRNIKTNLLGGTR